MINRRITTKYEVTKITHVSGVWSFSTFTSWKLLRKNVKTVGPEDTDTPVNRSEALAILSRNCEGGSTSKASEAEKESGEGPDWREHSSKYEESSVDHDVASSSGRMLPLVDLDPSRICTYRLSRSRGISIYLFSSPAPLSVMWQNWSNWYRFHAFLLFWLTVPIYLYQ
jgi:hypothetical protein